MRRALALTLSLAAAGAVATPALAAPAPDPAGRLFGAQHEAVNQGDPLTPEGSHSWEVRVQQVGGTWYAYAEHVRRYVDAAGDIVQTEEWTGLRDRAQALPAGVVSVNANGTSLTVAPVALPTTTQTFGPADSGPVPGTTTLSGTWKRQGSGEFRYAGIDADGDPTVDSACEGLSPTDVDADGARTDITVFGQQVDTPTAKTLHRLSLASYLLPRSEGC